MFNVALAQEAAAPAAPAAGGGMNSLLGFLPIVLIFVVLYFLMILPQQRRQKKHREMLGALKRGDRVILSAGFHGIITNVRENTFLVKIAENAEVEVDKSAVSGKLGGDSK
jgi:preprotein translocase subunit YajC